MDFRKGIIGERLVDILLDEVRGFAHLGGVTPSPCRNCTDYSLPVSRRTAKDSERYRFPSCIGVTRLERIINMKHELVGLAERINWAWLGSEIAPLYSDKGQRGRHTLRTTIEGTEGFLRRTIERIYVDNSTLASTILPPID